MKITKILLIFLFSLIASGASGQPTFNSQEINVAAKAFNDAQAKTTKWAENIAKMGHLDKDSNICWVFKVPAKDSLYIASIYDCIRMFVDQRRTERQIDYKESSAELIVIKTVFPKILFSDGSMSFAMSVDAYGEMSIKVEPKDLVLTMKVQRYVNTSPYGREVQPSFGTVWLPVKGVAPLKDNGNNKLWSKAFVNSNAECLNLANNFVGILNANYTRPEEY